MKMCVQEVFGPDVIVVVTSEPEAAFNYAVSQMMSEENKEQNVFNEYEHIILIDGGDGTFDNLYVKRWKESDELHFFKKH